MSMGASPHCVNGHLYAGSNLAYNKDGTRRCRTCQRNQQRRHRGKTTTRRADFVCPPTGWQDKGACRNHPTPDDFDALVREEVAALRGQAASTNPRISRALAICSSCPVLEQCHAWALATHQQGVWGGQYLSREALRKKGLAA